MTHFNQSCVDGNGLLAIEEDCTGFSLGGGCHNGAYGMALGEDRSVWNGSSLDVSFWDSNLSRYGHGGKPTEVGISHVQKTYPHGYQAQRRTLPR